jgi:hypothetical protein
VPDWIARKPPDPELHDGAGARAGDQHHCLLALWSCPTATRCSCRAPRLVWPTGWRPRFRAPAPSTGSSVSRWVISRQAKVLERPWSSTSAGVLDGLGRWRYARPEGASHEQQHRAAHPPAGRFLGRRRR